ncbi:MAG TPA: metallopeptidase family protein [Candidatus Saccharimonadia bacterium]|nr:metallopeptidase family protein [Candidatus Saccharimonadia bacterium]
MIHVSDQVFQGFVEDAVESIPPQFKSHLENVAFLVAEEPTEAQLTSGGVIHKGVTLLGLYEGIPLPRRGNGYNGVMPDTVTIFKRPHEVSAHDLEALRLQVHQTVWHEVAHYFGLDHGQIQALEQT